MHSYYRKKYGFVDEQFPNSYKYSNRVITLPLYPLLTEKEAKYVVNTLKKLWEKL